MNIICYELIQPGYVLYSYYYTFLSCTILYEWLSILYYMFCHAQLWMTIHIILGFRHAHLCTNDCPYHYRFSSFTSLYEWLSLFLWVFVMHISLRMTIHILFIWFFVMHISVRMTIHTHMGFRHAHLCTNDYP